MVLKTSSSIRVALPQEQIETFCRRHLIRKLALFGSVLREDFTEESDIDALVEFEPGAVVGLFDLARMARELTGIFGREVDLLTAGFLSPYIRQRVLNTAETIYEKES